ncbi:MAG: hypothetical protein DRQ98_09680 [Gammaproteobacteria bacterium]|nr:MAG: hypothetical protein DRQ98_09680 [Gammaproteobacteria bacterium]
MQSCIPKWIRAGLHGPVISSNSKENVPAVPRFLLRTDRSVWVRYINSMFQSPKMRLSTLNCLRAMRRQCLIVLGLEVANSHVTSLNALVQDVENMHEQGMVPHNDLLSAQVALADARQEAIRVQNGLDIAKSTYNRLLNRSLNQVVKLDAASLRTRSQSNHARAVYSAVLANLRPKRSVSEL